VGTEHAKRKDMNIEWRNESDKARAFNAVNGTGKEGSAQLSREADIAVGDLASKGRNMSSLGRGEDGVRMNQKNGQPFDAECCSCAYPCYMMWYDTCFFENGKGYAAEYGCAGGICEKMERTQKSRLCLTGVPKLLSYLHVRSALFIIIYLFIFSSSMTRPLGLPPRNKKEADVQMQTPITDLIHHLGNQDLAFLLRPAEDFADEAEGVGLDAHGHVFALVAADFFHLGVFGPGTDGDLRRISMPLVAG